MSAEPETKTVPDSNAKTPRRDQACRARTRGACAAAAARPCSAWCWPGSPRSRPCWSSAAATTRWAPRQILNVLFGGGQGLENTIVFQWRAPRAVAALVFGAALGVAGAVFQSLTRNPLGSPDVIGFSTGAYTGALLALTLVGEASSPPRSARSPAGCSRPWPCTCWPGGAARTASG